MKNVILEFSEQETNKGKCLECEIVLTVFSFPAEEFFEVCRNVEK